MAKRKEITKAIAEAMPQVNYIKELNTEDYKPYQGHIEAKLQAACVEHNYPTGNWIMFSKALACGWKPVKGVLVGFSFGNMLNIAELNADQMKAARELRKMYDPDAQAKIDAEYKEKAKAKKVAESAADDTDTADDPDIALALKIAQMLKSMK